MSSMLRFPEADDPFGLVFESVSELTERIKEALELRVRRGRPARRGLERRAAEVGAHLLHAQGRRGVDPGGDLEERRRAGSPST